MAAWCLVQQEADKFIQAIKDGSINPFDMAKMSSEERHAYIEKFISKDNATQVNALFESKLLAKNYQKGLMSWVEKVGNLKPEAKRDLVTKIDKMSGVLNPGENKPFLKDLAEQKLGVGVSETEAKKIFDLSEKIKETQKNITDEKSRIAYGNAILDLHDYVDSLTHHSMGIVGNVVNVANVPRAIMSSLDFSAPLRQGFGMLAQPKEFASAFGNMFKYAASKQSYRDLMANIITHPNYDLAKSAGLRITNLADKLSQREESFATTLIDKVPGISHSERAYTGFLDKLRFDTFNKYLEQAKRNGENVSKGSQALKDIASVVNDFTGTGDIGKNDKFGGAVPFLNSLFFSPRKIAATLNILNPVKYATLSPTARSLAIRNVIGMVGISAMTLMLAESAGAKVETDPRSSDFGKFVVGNTRVDVTGGNVSYLVLLSRLISGQTKSTTTGIISDLKSGFASTSKGDILVNFGKNKLSPTASFISDWLYGKDASGNAFNVGNEVKSRLVPLVMQDTLSSLSQDPTNALLTSFLDTFGMGVQTYGQTGSDWTQQPTGAQSAFLQRVGDATFKQANQDFNNQYNDWLKGATSNPKYQALSESSKQSVITAKKANLQKDIFKKYGFVYKKTTTPQDKSTQQQIRSLAQ